MDMRLNDIAKKFIFAGEPQEVTPLGQGFINDTFVVSVEGSDERYILQRKNKSIFTDVPAMMDNIERVCEHIKSKVCDPLREAMTIIRTKDGELYCIDDDGEYWAASLLIEPTVAYDSANSPETAYQGGKGIGLFQKMLCDFEGELADILPGFHNMRFRFEQWDSALREDRAGRLSALSEEVSWIESRRDEMMAFYALI